MSEEEDPILDRLIHIESEISSMKADIKWLKKIVILILTGLIGMLWAVIGGM